MTSDAVCRFRLLCSVLRCFGYVYACATMFDVNELLLVIACERLNSSRRAASLFLMGTLAGWTTPRHAQPALHTRNL